MVRKSAKDFFITMSDHDRAENDPEYQQTEGLQAVEITQGDFPPGNE
jgi:hypothetical protein